jgi:hypothetical protein
MSKSLALAALAVLPLAGCAIVSSPVGNGLLFTQVKAPVLANEGPRGTKTGTSKAMNALGLIAMGDASIETAAKQGGITKITHIDHDSFSVLFLFSSYTITVYGE